MNEIVSSVIAYDLPQVDGRRNIHEVHTNSNGATYDFFYTADADEDVNARMLARVPSVLPPDPDGD